MDARISLSSQITEAGYPDLELSDIYGKKVRLSSLAGKSCCSISGRPSWATAIRSMPN